MPCLWLKVSCTSPLGPRTWPRRHLECFQFGGFDASDAKDAGMTLAEMSSEGLFRADKVLSAGFSREEVIAAGFDTTGLCKKCLSSKLSAVPYSLETKCLSCGHTWEGV